MRVANSKNSTTIDDVLVVALFGCLVVRKRLEQYIPPQANTLRLKNGRIVCGHLAICCTSYFVWFTEEPTTHVELLSESGVGNDIAVGWLLPYLLQVCTRILRRPMTIGLLPNVMPETFFCLLYHVRSNHVKGPYAIKASTDRAPDPGHFCSRLSLSTSKLSTLSPMLPCICGVKHLFRQCLHVAALNYQLRVV